jgi:hypothetical protein
MNIRASLEIMCGETFSRCSRLTEVTFEAGSDLREIYGFDGCALLIWIDISTSVEVIRNSSTFSGEYSGLKEMIFERAITSDKSGDSRAARH